MKEQFQRTAMLFGEEGIEKLNRARVAVFGIGGVGGYCVEALARAGIGALDLIDSDIVCESNLNRQIIATYKTLGKAKVDAAKERVESINPDCIVNAIQAFVLTETNPENNAVKLRASEIGAACCSPEDASVNETDTACCSPEEASHNETDVACCSPEEASHNETDVACCSLEDASVNETDAACCSLEDASVNETDAACCSPKVVSDSEAEQGQIIELDFLAYDYVVDAIDTVSGKLAIIEMSKRAGVPVISCMGTGNKMNPAALCVSDLFQTSVCPLAKVMRHECRKRGIEELKVVYSTEPALKPCMIESPEEIRPKKSSEETETPEATSPGNSSTEEKKSLEATCQGNSSTEEKKSSELSAPKPGRKKTPPGSNSFVPPAAGLLLASEVIKDLIK